jgi:hypothetical protein
MGFYRHVSTFAGLPVREFTADADNSRSLRGESSGGADIEPGAVAWRVATDYDGGAALFDQIFTALVDAPWAGQIRALVIGEWGHSYDRDAPIERLVAAADRLTGLTALFLGEMTSEENEVSWIQQGDVAPLLTAYPLLKVLRVRGSTGLALSVVRHEALRELAFESGGLPAEVVGAVAACEFPALRHLELWLGTDNYGGDADIDDLVPILTGTGWPALEYLGLRDAEIADDIAAALAGAPVVARIKTLDLSQGMLSDAGAAALLAGQPLIHLRELDLHHHFLTEAMQARLRDELEPAGVEVDLSDAQDASDDIDDRFIAVSE